MDYDVGNFDRQIKKMKTEVSLEKSTRLSRIKGIESIPQEQGLARGFALVDMKLQPTSFRLIAKKIHQLPIGEKIYGWVVSDESYYKRVLTNVGTIRLEPMVPCICICQSKKKREKQIVVNVSLARLKNSKSKSCGCKRNLPITALAKSTMQGENPVS